MTAPTVVFDLDGTLVDTAPDLIATLHVVFEREGLRVPATDLRNMIGGGARRLIERALRKERVAVSKGEIDRLYTGYIEHYAAHIAERSRPFPGLEAALETLAEDGCRFAVCTNKLEFLAVRLLEELRLAERFVAICGQDTFGLQKPDPDMLRQTLAKARGSIERVLVVGDSGNDVEMAHKAAVPVVAVDFGYTEAPISMFGPDRIISRFDQLPAIARELLGVQH